MQYFPLSIHLANLYDQHKSDSDGKAELVLKAIQEMFMQMHYRFVASAKSSRNNQDVAAVIHLGDILPRDPKIPKSVADWDLEYPIHVHGARSIPDEQETGSSKLWEVRVLELSLFLNDFVLSLSCNELCGNPFEALYPNDCGTQGSRNPSAYKCK